MILLDTDVVSCFLRPAVPPSKLADRLHAIPAGNRYVSAISIGEVLFGVMRTGRHEAIRRRLETEFLRSTEVLPFDLDAARIYAEVKCELWRKGQPIGEADLRIASIALAKDLTLITGNEAHFQRVPRLRVENWLKE